MKFAKIAFCFLFFPVKIFAQQNTITIIDSGHNTSLRGLSIVDNNIIWASGSNGTVARSTNGGKSFEWLTVNSFEQRDFRDIEAFDANTALIMAVAEPAIILKTKDGGKNWYKVFEDTTKGMFLDAMDFADKKTGMVIGDPANGQFFMASTWNGGENWILPKGSMAQNIPYAFDGEAFFAASGTNIFLQKNSKGISGAFVSGGIRSRLFIYDEIDSLPMLQGSESTGANSICIFPVLKKGIIVGGDFAKDKDTTGNCVLLNFRDSVQFSKPQEAPHGYRSCVIYISDQKLVTCGTSGVDISNDGGMNWQLISNQSFHVCEKAKAGKAVFLAGANGKIAKFSY